MAFLDIQDLTALAGAGVAWAASSVNGTVLEIGGLASTGAVLFEAEA